MGNSFAAGALVLMADGSDKPIEDVKVGDAVENADPDSSVRQQHKVTAVHVTDTDTDFVDLAVGPAGAPKTITVTAHHLFWDATTPQWTDAADLRVGDQLDTPGDGHVAVVSSHRYTKPIRTYNLTIDTVHTYYVLAGKKPILVHNDGSEPAGCFRGARSGESPSFVPRPNDYKVDPARGFVKETHGLSVFDNPESVAGKGFVPHDVDMESVPDSLRIIQRGADPRHFEVVPAPGANLTPEQYADALSQIRTR